jgi:uncharacterized membrane protein YhiD involved in acid resistance
MDILDLLQIQDLTSEFSAMDVALALALSFALSAFISWLYQITHRGASYTQSFAFTLVINGMVVALVMMIVGSNIARAFSLVGALSIIRFRNAVKETRDVGFIFFSMAIGMAVGTRFYALAVIGAAGISLAVVLMVRLNWFAREMSSQILRVQVPSETPFDALFDRIFLKYTRSSELIGADAVHGGMLTELTYSVGLKHADQVQPFLADIQRLSGNNKVTLIAGYNGTDF